MKKEICGECGKEWKPNRGDDTSVCPECCPYCSLERSGKMKDLVAKDYTIGSALILQRANELVIKTQEDYDGSNAILLYVKSVIKERTEYFEPLRKKAKESYDEVLEKKNEALKPPAHADKIVRNKRQVFRDEQDRLLREKQRRLQEAARVKEVQEKKTLQKRADDSKKDITKELLEERVEDVYVEPVFAEPVVETKNIRKELEVKIMDEMLVIKAIANGVLPIGCAKIVESKVKAYIKLTDKKPGTVPGVWFRWSSKDVVRG